MTGRAATTRTEVTGGGDISPEELAAVVGAIEVTMGQTQHAPTEHVAVPRWRFSGRWWSKPVPLRRTRPWYH